MRYGIHSVPGHTSFGALGQETSSGYRAAAVHLQSAQFRPNFRQRESGSYDTLGWRNVETLFTTTPAKISGAFADPSLTAAVPTLLGMALNEGRKQGYGITYDSSLSKHSAPLARKGLKMGLVQRNVENPNARKNNMIDKGPVLWGRYDAQEYKEAPPEQVKAGRETIREIIRKEPEPTPQTNWLNEYNSGEDRPGPGKGQQSLRLGAQFGAHYEKNKQMELFKGKDYQVKLPKQEEPKAEGTWFPEPDPLAGHLTGWQRLQNPRGRVLGYRVVPHQPMLPMYGLARRVAYRR